MLQGYQEQIIYHYVLGDLIYVNVARPEFFTNDILKQSFDVAKEYVLKYKEPPSKEQFSQLIKIKGLSDKLSDDVINSLYNTKALLSQYEDTWLKENIGAWIQTRNLDNVMRKAIAYMKTTKIGVENASEVVENIRHMISSETAVDFNYKSGLDFFDPTSHLQTRLARTSTGYAYIDQCLKGGYWKGSLVVFLSGPKAGKSMWLGNLAAKSSLAGHNTAYITLELQGELVNMRIGSNVFNIPLDNYEEIIKDQDFLRKKINALKAGQLLQPGYLDVKEFPSSTMSANDLEAFLLKEQELLGIKFDNVFVDYINIMKNWRNPNSENTYLKIKQISEDLRAIAQKNSWCVITATQTNRGGWETSDLNITDIAESAGLLHTVDVMFGIITNAEMKAKGEYFLKCLADRVTAMENTKKRYTIDWKFGRIEEDSQSQIQDMDSFITGLHGAKPKQPPKTSLWNPNVTESPQPLKEVEKITVETVTNLDDLNSFLEPF